MRESVYAAHLLIRFVAAVRSWAERLALASVPEARGAVVAVHLVSIRWVCAPMWTRALAFRFHHYLLQAAECTGFVCLCVIIVEWSVSCVLWCGACVVSARAHTRFRWRSDRRGRSASSSFCSFSPCFLCCCFFFVCFYGGLRARIRAFGNYYLLYFSFDESSTRDRTAGSRTRDRTAGG